MSVTPSLPKPTASARHNTHLYLPIKNATVVCFQTTNTAH